MARLTMDMNKALPFSAIAILLFFFNVNTIPLNPEQNAGKLDDMIVSSGNLQLKRDPRDTHHLAKFKSHNFGNWSKFRNHSFDDWSKFKNKNFGNWTKFDWKNFSISDRLDEMMESLERDLEELMNDTVSFTDFLKNSETFADVDDFFSFSSSESFSDSESASESGEELVL